MESTTSDPTYGRMVTGPDECYSFRPLVVVMSAGDETE